MGAGFSLRRGKKIIKENKFKLPDHCTVFQAEIFAINRITKYLLENAGCKFLKIFIDSQAAILALGNTQVSSSLVMETKTLLNQLSEVCKKVTLVWTRAHVGTEGNERADSLAKEGGKGNNISNVPAPVGILKAEIEEIINQEWNEEWMSYKAVSYTHLTLPTKA